MGQEYMGTRRFSASAWRRCHTAKAEWADPGQRENKQQQLWNYPNDNKAQQVALNNLEMMKSTQGKQRAGPTPGIAFPSEPPLRAALPLALRQLAPEKAPRESSSSKINDRFDFNPTPKRPTSGARGARVSHP